jgi:carbon monoxide dehydrogenase subunit G
MQLKYNHTFGLPRNIVWKYLKDAAILKSVIPNCKEFAETSEGTYKGKIDVHVGPLKDVLDLEVRRLKEISPSYYRLGVKVKGNLGTINGMVEIFLKDLHSSTELSLSAEATGTGAIGLAGEKTLENSAKKNMEKIFQGIEKEIKLTLYNRKR